MSQLVVSAFDRSAVLHKPSEETASDEIAAIERDQRAQAAAEVAEHAEPFLQWALRIPTAKGNPLDFDRFPFQRELYEVFGNPEIREADAQKSVQVGVSELLARLTLYFPTLYGYTGLYVFPALKQMHDFCLHESERVLMADGTLRRIADVRVGERVWSSDGERVVADEVEHVWDRGRGTIVRVELRGGRQLRATAQHRVWTRRGWVPVGDLAEGDEVAVPRLLPPPEAESDLSDDDAFLLALWIAEGTKPRAGFTFTNGLPEVRARAVEIAAARGWEVWEADRHTVALTARWSKAETTPAALLRRYGLRGMRTETVAIPDEVMCAPLSAAREFVRTYIACDGYIGQREITVASVSERLVRDLQVLCARLGIVATVRSQQPAYPGARRCWVLAVAEHESRARIAAFDVPGKPVRLRATDATRARRAVEPNGMLGWAKVTAITVEGGAATFDLTTKRHHAFFVEGALTHNSDTRVNPLRENSPYLQSKSRLGPDWTWNKGLKRVGAGFTYYRGSESKRDLIAVDADVVAMDEYDLLHPPNVPEAEKRVAASPIGLLRRVGVPSDPEYGIARRYGQSDMRKWMVKCGCKAGWQPIDFWKNVEWDEDGDAIERPRIVCVQCRKPLDVLTGQWVAEQPSRSRPGFHLHRLMVPGERNLRMVIEDSKQTDPLLVESFWQNDLGLPHTSETGGLDRKAIAAALSAAQSFYGQALLMQPAYVGTNLVTMGVDVASVRSLHVRISEHLDPLTQVGHRKRALWIGTVESFNDLPDLMNRYRVAFCAIDHLPEGRLARGFAQMYPGRVYVVHYATHRQADALVVNTDDLTASARHVEALDAMVAVTRAQRNLLPEDMPAEYVEHMVTPRRIVTRDEKDRIAVQWIARGPMDFFQAEVYDLLATEIAKVRLGYEDMTRDETWLLDERLEFERSNLGGYDDAGYDPGPRMEEYEGGPGYDPDDLR